MADRPATIRRSTVSGNHAQAGGGVNLPDRTPLITPTITHTTIEKSTISHNFSQKSGGVRVSTTPEHYLGIDQSTIADNQFGGLSAKGDSDVELIGTLVADNTDFPSPRISLERTSRRDSA